MIICPLGHKMGFPGAAFLQTMVFYRSCLVSKELLQRVRGRSHDLRRFCKSGVCRVCRSRFFPMQLVARQGAVAPRHVASSMEHCRANGRGCIAAWSLAARVQAARAAASRLHHVQMPILLGSALPASFDRFTQVH